LLNIDTFLIEDWFTGFLEQEEWFDIMLNHPRLSEQDADNITKVLNDIVEKNIFLSCPEYKPPSI
jgi:hypothetical protein